MKIRQLTAFVVRLPLKQKFAHASALRDESENFLVKCELADGTSGWGESVPRSYVTGETPQTCLDQLGKTPVRDLFARECSSWGDVIAMCEHFSPAQDALRESSHLLDLCDEGPDGPTGLSIHSSLGRGSCGNALQCGVELSILDAFGKLFNSPVSAVAGQYAPARPILSAQSQTRVQYSAVIDAGSHRLIQKALARRVYGFHQCKVKVGAAGDDDALRLRTIRRWIGPRVDLRLDANEAWRPAELRERLAALVPFGISCIEQPVRHADVSALAELRPQLGLPVMLDESLTSDADARAAIERKTCDLFNIRLSKCGGFFASLRLAAIARAAGLGYQLGCHPGETGILSAAGRHWACAVDGVRYLEGSYDRYLFGSRLLTNEDLTFGYAGRAPALAGPGLGVTMNEQRLGEVTLEQKVFPIA